MTASVRMRDISMDTDTKTPRGTPRGPATGGFFSFGNSHGGPKGLLGLKPHVIERGERTSPLSKSPRRTSSSPTPIPRSSPRARIEKTPRPGRDQSPLLSPRVNPSQKARFFGSNPQPPLFPTTPPRDIPPRIRTTDDRPSKYQRKTTKPSKSRDISDHLDELTTTLAIDTEDVDGDEDDLSSPDDNEGKKKGDLPEDEEQLHFSSPSLTGQQRRLSQSSRASTELRKHSSTPSTPRQFNRYKPPFLRRITPGTSPAAIERTVFAMGRSPCSEASDRIERIDLDSPHSPGQMHRIHIPAVDGQITFPDPGSAHSSPSSSPTFEWEEQKPIRKLPRTSGECTQLLDFLFVGGQNIAQDLEKLKANGITHVVNCAADVCDNYFESHFTYLALHLHDSTDEDLISVLYGIIDFIENARLHGGKVFVHCQQGASRSPSVSIGYLMAIREEDFKPIADLLHQHRNISRPNLNFSCQLTEWRRRVTRSVSQKAFLYRVATHSPRDSLLVGKWVDKITSASLDERSVFILHSYSLTKTYIFVGAACEKKELYCETAKKVANWLHLYEHAPLEIEWIYSGQTPISGNTADQFWKLIDSDFEGEIGYLARSYNKDYDKDYGDSSSLPSLSGGIAKDVEKEEHPCEGDNDCEFKLDDLPAIMPSSSPVDSGVESQKRDSTSGDLAKDLKAFAKITESHQSARLFEYPAFNIFTCYDLTKLDSCKVYIRLLSHNSSTSSSTSLTSSVKTSSEMEQYYPQLQPPSSVYIHVWVGKNFVVPNSSTLTLRKSSPISTPSSPSRQLDLPVLSLPLFISEPSTSVTDSEIGTDRPPSPESPKSTSLLLFAEHVSLSLQKIIKLKHERTQFHTVLEEEGNESAAFSSF